MPGRGDRLIAGLIGDHIQNTRLPAALGLLCRAAGVALEFELIDSAKRSGFAFGSEADGLAARGWTGVSVTHPHKLAAAHYVGDGMEADAAHLGACNLLRFDPGGVVGFNTDYSGFLSAWRAFRGDAAPGRVAMAGAGGVARALGPALAALGAAEIVIWDLDQARAQTAAAALGPLARAVPIAAAADETRAADGLVNATAVGFGDGLGSALPLMALGGQSWAFDAVYTPTDTAFLKAAADAGVDTLTGFDLFSHMAIHTFEAYTGRCLDPPNALETLAALRPT